MTTTQPRPRRKPPGRPTGTSDTKETILSCARDLFARTGFNNTSVRAIASVSRRGASFGSVTGPWWPRGGRRREARSRTGNGSAARAGTGDPGGPSLRRRKNLSRS